MKPVIGGESVSLMGRPARSRGWGGLLLGAQVLWVAILGCGHSEVAPFAHEPELSSTVESPLQSINSMTPNGLIMNGLIMNGLSTNGLIMNGLIMNGLSTTTFQDWFNANPEGYSNMVMKYVVGCAVASGQSRTWTNPVTQVSYTWDGVLGLTPDWVGGLPATEWEQQLITACLAAHTNKYGLQVLVSVQGLNAKGVPLPRESNELTTFSVLEGAFFGNLAAGDSAYVCRGSNLNSKESSIRACGLASQDKGASLECPPLVHVGSCSSYCKLDSTKTYYTQCTYGGKTYAPLTTRLRSSDVYICGDGVCQVSETCGDQQHYNNCKDCGPCP
ncbi:hypothetical protein [Cystobacter ferrugineus]|uniref:Uncharacterized protein n=1 Tax=Cystobacter ferrugineus TaxID=83449 RepID=A0A1L9B1V9_9BACT|nr:hypothetical protein [Cystobacter ferrugineus]OJH36244.1 hypothetical protein BON30_34365 [Cystobacter ferrugineus]